MTLRILASFPILLCLLLSGAAPAADPPTSIAEGIEQLGARDFDTREAATAWLWVQGDAALPALREARKSDDPEVAERAAEVLAKIESGILPDTPEDVVAAVKSYDDKQETERSQILLNLLKRDPPAVVTAIGLMRRDKQPTVAQRIWQDATLLPHLQAMRTAGTLSDAHFMTLVLQRARTSHTHAADFIALQLLDGTLAAAISRQEEMVAANQDDDTGEALLARLYWAAGQPEAAVAMARRAQAPELARLMLLHSQNYAELARSAAEQARDRSFLPLAHALTAARLAGSDPAQQDAYAEALKGLAAGDPGDVFYVAEVLLVNRRVDEALALLAANQQWGTLLPLLRQRGDLAAARDAAQSIVTDAAAGLSIGQARPVYDLYLDLGMDDALRTALQKHLSDAGDKPAQLESLLDYYIEVGLLDEAHRIGLAAMSTALQDHAALPNRFHPHGVLLWQYLTFQNPERSLDALYADWAQQVAGLDLARLAEIAPKLEADLPKAAAAEQWKVRRPLAEAYRYLGDTAGYLRQWDVVAQENHVPEMVQNAASAHVLAEDWMRAADLFGEAARLIRQTDPAKATTPLLADYAAVAALIQAGHERPAKRRQAELDHLLLGDGATRWQIAQGLASQRFYDLASELLRTNFLLLGGGRDFYMSESIRLQAVIDENRETRLGEAADYYEISQFNLLDKSSAYTAVAAYISVPASIEGLRLREALGAGDVAAAQQAYSRAAQVMPDDPDRTIALVVGLRKLGQGAEAEAALAAHLSAIDRALEAFPNHAGLHNAWAWAAANCHRRLDDALTHAQTATRLRPGSSAYLDTLAEVYFHLGRREEAVAAQTRAMTLCRWGMLSFYLDRLKRFRDEPIPTDQAARP